MIPINCAEDAFWWCKDYMAFCLEWIVFEHEMVAAYRAMAASPEGRRAVWRYHFCNDAIHDVLIPAARSLRAICNCDRCRRIDEQQRLAAWALNDQSFGYRRVRVSERNHVGVKANSLFASHDAKRVIPATTAKTNPGRSNQDDAAATGVGGELRHSPIPQATPAPCSPAYYSRAPPSSTHFPGFQNIAISTIDFQWLISTAARIVAEHSVVGVNEERLNSSRISC